MKNFLKKIKKIILSLFILSMLFLTYDRQPDKVVKVLFEKERKNTFCVGELSPSDYERLIPVLSNLPELGTVPEVLETTRGVITRIIQVTTQGETFTIMSSEDDPKLYGNLRLSNHYNLSRK